MSTPGSSFTRSVSRIFWPALALAICTLQVSRAHPQGTAVNTPADFENARTKAEDGLASARTVLNANRALRNQAEDDVNSLSRYTSTREAE